ncbi:MAG: hypothetical protein JWN36_2614 [Microbacteriaceae bacterium]|nr:hypothetical protein [Microbacteriaceae bacterium]
MTTPIAESLAIGAIVAARASVRAVAPVAAVTVLPGALAGGLLSAVGLPTGIAWSPLLAVALYCLSYFTHELGHAAAAVLTGRAVAIEPALRSEGDLRRASIVGTSLGRYGDALVSVAGPAFGLAPALALLLPGGPFLVRAPFVLLFLTHLLELRPGRSDGAALHAVRARKDPHARRD